MIAPSAPGMAAVTMSSTTAASLPRFVGSLIAASMSVRGSAPMKPTSPSRLIGLLSGGGRGGGFSGFARRNYRGDKRLRRRAIGLRERLCRRQFVDELLVVHDRSISLRRDDAGLDARARRRANGRSDRRGLIPRAPAHKSAYEKSGESGERGVF